MAEGSIRLLGGLGAHEGRVEVYILGHWTTVCANDWGLEDAVVVCHQLGFSDAVAAPRGSAFGAGSGPIVLSNFSCSGYEMNITYCEHSFPVSTCYANNSAGVICSSAS